MVYQRSFREILHVFLRRKTLFAVVFGAVGLVGGAYLLLKTPLYMSDASLVLHFGNQTVPDIDRSEKPTQLEGSNEHREILYSDAAILNSPDVLRQVIDKVGLATLFPQIAAGSDTADRKEDLAVRAFQSNLTVDVGLNSDVINVSYLNPSAVVVHTAVVQLLNEFYQQEADVYANPQLKFAEGEAKTARTSLTEAQNELEAFKSSHQIANLPEQVGQLLQQRTDVESRWRIAQGQVLEAQEQEDALTKLIKTIPATTNSSAAGEEYQAADTAEARLDALKAKRSQLASTYRDNSPIFRELDAQIGSLSHAVNERTAQSRSRTGYKPNEVYQSIRTDLLRATAQATAAKQPVQVLQDQLKQINDRLNDLEAQQNRYDDLTQTVQIHSDTYRSLAIRYQTARVEANRNAQRISAAVLIAAPIVPTQPARPRKKLVAFGTLLTALILAVGTVLAIEAFDDRFRTPADVTRILRLPVLATFAGDAD
jgi:polysaccharide biosynthesis protein PslE